MATAAIGTEATYEKDPNNPDARFTADAVRAEINRQGGIGPLQFVGQKGTAIYNYPPSSPEMEAIYGKKVYAPRKEQNREQILADKLEAEQKRNAAMEAKLNVLLMQMVGKAPAVAQDQSESEEEDTVSFAELRREAKAKGINTKGMTREKIEAALQDVDG